MSTEDDLRDEREQRLLEHRRDEQAAARRVLKHLAARSRLTPGQTGQLLDMCGLTGEPDAAGTPPGADGARVQRAWVGAVSAGIGRLPVMEDDAVKLGIQAWAGTQAPAREKFKAASGRIRRSKPDSGGLWTSTWDDQTGGGWIDWCRENGFRGPTFDVWLLTPDPSARIYGIDSLADLVRLVNLYPAQYTGLYESPCVDWVAAAAEWDAVHLTDEGQWRTRLSVPADLYGWDCESTLWLRWSFTAVVHRGVWEAVPR